LASKFVMELVELLITGPINSVNEIIKIISVNGGLEVVLLTLNKLKCTIFSMVTV
jgi:hypothetical protein